MRHILGFAVTALALPTSAAQSATACGAAEHRQFDFWVGRWDVSKRGDDKIVAHSLIEPLYDGCAIRENWMPLKGTAGGSLNAWLPDEGKWRQTWVDAGNSYVTFEGGLVDGRMVLAGLWRNGGGPGVHQSYRITWSREPGGRVRQHGEITPDQGRSWQTSFDFIYAPAGQQRQR